ncbi:MAG: hypothetical protein Q9195_000231 [Heterodermia aff. obscurata]
MGKKFVSTKEYLPALLRKRFGSKDQLIRMLYESPPLAMLLLVISLGSILLKTELRQRISGTAKKLQSKHQTVMGKAENEVRDLEDAFPNNVDVQLVCLSIRALLWSLRNAIANRNPSTLKRTSLELGSSSYLKSLLIQRGMCPHYLATIEDRSSVAALHYLAGIPRSIGPHRHCARQSCTAYILDPIKYKTQHVNIDCDCGFVEPDTIAIRKSIDSGQVPVVRISVHDNQVHLITQEASFDNPYAALSHVWSGGLGNLQASSLPACQLRRIYQVLRGLAPPSTGTNKKKWYEKANMGWPKSEKDVEHGTDIFIGPESCAFWMDTLCLPKDRPQRDLALGQMTRIYAGAQRVVVIDNALQSMSSTEEQDEVILASLVSSPWMSRCWTFQEGRLAQLLHLNVDGNLRDPFTIYDQVAAQAAVHGPGRGMWSDAFQLHRELSAALFKMRPLKDERSVRSDLQDFIDIWNELVSRTTSWPDDKLRILSLMLDLNVNELEHIPGDLMKLKAILRSQEELPSSFLFIETRSSRGSSEDCWVPADLTQNIASRTGSMWKTLDIGTGEPGFKIEFETHNIVCMKFAENSSSQLLDVLVSRESDDDNDYMISLKIPDASIGRTTLSNNTHLSKAARRMTTTQKPTHPYAFWLFQWEQFLGTGALVVVLVTFPSKANNGIQPAAVDWTMYAFCLTAIFCRLLYVLFKECPSLNRLAKLNEYQNWTDSFATPHGIPSASDLIRLHRFRPWWVTCVSLGTRIGLLAAGRVVAGANMFEMSITGGYLIGIVLPLAVIEAFWRSPGGQTVKQGIHDQVFGRHPSGYDDYNFLKLFSLATPRSVSHSQRNLDAVFGDPLYLPE